MKSRHTHVPGLVAGEQQEKTGSQDQERQVIHE